MLEYVFIWKVRNFSDENIHKPGSKDPINNQNLLEVLKYRFITNVYANGMNAREKGYVSIDFSGLHPPMTYAYGYNISCVVSVIDASGFKRFPTSYVVSLEKRLVYPFENSPLKIDRLIKRETLLSEPDELLPEDCLTLHFHIIVHTRPCVEDLSKIDICTPLEFFSDENFLLFKFWLMKDRLIRKSLLTQVLPEFRGERNDMLLTHEEFQIFLEFHSIFLEQNIFYLKSVRRLRDIYDMGDKYEVPAAVEICRCFLPVLLCAAETDDVIKVHMMREIRPFRKLAKRRHDIRLKEIVESFLERNSDDNHNDNKTVESAAYNLETEWRLEFVGEKYSYFKFTRVNREDTSCLRFYQ